jgi:L-arabinonolactonase
MKAPNYYKVTPNPKPVVDLPSFLNGPRATLNEDQISVTAQLIVDCRCQLGECILWDDQTQEILFISILDRTFHKLKLVGNNDNNNNKDPLSLLATYQLPKMVGAFGLLESPPEPGAYLVGWEDGFQLYNFETNRPLSEMSTGESVNPLGLPDRLNDGRCDPTGERFICGGCAANAAGPLKVYKCEYNSDAKRLEHEPIIDSIQTTNSICWSIDGRTMYLADSPELNIHQYDYNTSTGSLSNKRHFHDKPTGFADGSCVDEQGYVWNATWREGKGTGFVQRLDPKTGKAVFTVHLPDNTSEASCVCFGGPNLDILFITTAWEHLDPSTEPRAGGLYAVKLPEGMFGLLEKRFITV